MKKILAAAAMSVIAIGTMQLPSFADAWFDHYDHDHDGHWNYNEFRRAHMDWAKRHHEAERMNDAALRAQWNQWDVAHHGWVNPEQVREFHHWD